MEITRNLVIIQRKVYRIFEEYLWKLRKISRKFCGNFTESLKNACRNYEKFREGFMVNQRKVCRNFIDILKTFYRNYEKF